MCSSKPKIPNTKTPPAPNAPEPTPDAPTISERGLFLRGQGFKIGAKPDLSGLGSQAMGPVSAANALRIGPSSSTVKSQAQINADAAAAQAASDAAAREVARRRASTYKMGGRGVF